VGSLIEQYAMLGDTQTAALVADDGSVDWLCAPRFDSPACFAALLGTPDHGRWLLAPAAGGRASTRRYRDNTLVLETEFETPEGAVRIVDCMPIRDRNVDLVRIVEGVRGRVPMRMDLGIRFDYGAVVPWVHAVDDAIVAIAGPNGLCLRTPIETRGQHLRTVAEFEVAKGDRSRRSPTPPRVGCSPRQPHRCPSGSGACATGTTGTAGCAMPPSRCMPS
jgi:GH15 family glucan-1,4-alpha-glucosidase